MCLAQGPQRSDAGEARTRYNKRSEYLHKHIGAATCDFQQCGILTSVDPDELVQPPVKLRNSK